MKLTTRICATYYDEWQPRWQLFCCNFVSAVGVNHSWFGSISKQSFCSYKNRTQRSSACGGGGRSYSNTNGSSSSSGIVCNGVTKSVSWMVSMDFDHIPLPYNFVWHLGFDASRNSFVITQFVANVTRFFYLLCVNQLFFVPRALIL